MSAYTSANPLEGQVGDYIIETKDLAELGRHIALYPIGEDCPDFF